MAARAANLSLFTAFLSFSAVAGTAVDLPHFSLAPKALYEAASAASVPDGSDISFLAVEETYRFAADGSDVYTQHMIYKILTPAGAERWSSMALDWSPWRDQRPQFKARTVSADGTEYMLDAAAITDSPVRHSDANIFSDERTLHAPLPAVAPGAVVETEMIMRNGPDFAASGRVGRSFLQMSEPAQRIRLTLEAPESLSLRYRVDLLPNLQPLKSQDNGVVQWVFDSGPVSAGDNTERNVPGDIHKVPVVTFSTGDSWQVLAQSYSRAINERIAQSNVSDLAARLVKGKQTTAEKTAAIIEYMNREIRYTGIEFDQASVLPHSPAETLKHRYGDCKDKSTLLVALLRASGVSADLALLNAGDRLEMPEELPGMGLFDHAIVYVPGEPSIWIDATDEDAKIGQLADLDHGRLALIVNDQTTALTRVPDSRSIDNVDHQEREIYLQASGPARIIETSKPRGNFESEYRDTFANLADKKTKDDLIAYFKSEYDAEKLDGLERSDPKDFSQAFRLTLESKRAERGYTNLTEASVYIPLGGLFSNLPSELRTREPQDEKADEMAARNKKRMYDFQLNRPFVAEWDYKIVPPAGFEPGALPPDASLDLGPARLTEHFSAAPDGAIHGLLRFDTVKRRFTAAEQSTLRNKVAELKDADSIRVKFDLTAHKLLTQGHPRESFQAYRDLVASHPKDAVQHLRRADALLTAGMGEAARTEARMATTLDPRSALAEKTLADVLKHDLMGRELGEGADYAGAARAFRAAIALDPDDKSLVANYAILLEYDSVGLRYGPSADLKGAIAEYEKLSAQERADLGIANNLAFTLFYAREFEAAKRSAENLKSPPLGLLIACQALLRDVPQALEEAHRRTGAEADFKEKVTAAAGLLRDMREYAKSAQLYEAGASNAKSLSLAEMLRRTTRVSLMPSDGSAEDFVRGYFVAVLRDNFTEENQRLMNSLSANEAAKNFNDDERAEVANQIHRAALLAARAGISRDVLADITVRAIQIKSAGDDVTGYRETILVPGQKNQVIFVVKEQGRFKLLDSSDLPTGLPIEVLERVKRGDIAGASQLLDWLRDVTKPSAADDPFEGDIFPRFWNAGHGGLDPQKITLGAASLLVQSRRTARYGIAVLEHAKSSATSESDLENIDLALMIGHSELLDNEATIAAATELMQRGSTSQRVFIRRTASLRALNRFEEADRLARERLKAAPDDLAALRALEFDLVAQRKYAEAYGQALKIAAHSDSVAEDINQAAWLSLYFARQGGPDIDNATRAAQAAENNPAALHTLACVYAELGKTKEAREVLLQTMDARGVSQPDSNLWYTLGRIAEQYGERDIALADYAKVTAPAEPSTLLQSTYQLAQIRVAALKSAPPR
jgi:transglutaminase-like putative cysteine protease/Flp pilus assembly protein TadD